MSIVTGTALDPAVFFQAPKLPSVQGSTFSLSIGGIYDSAGKEVKGPFVLKPGAMVQVVSAEIFNLPDTVTGHVTYKTSLTRSGIWALTVGIVDPGWNGPIATTLLNFSRVDHTVQLGTPFLRVTLFEHASVPAGKKVSAPAVSDYIREVQSLASSRFPTTFLDSDSIAARAAKDVMDRIRNVGLAWFGATAILFAVIQVMAPPLSRMADGWLTADKLDVLHSDMRDITSRLVGLEAQIEAASPDAPR